MYHTTLATKIVIKLQMFTTVMKQVLKVVLLNMWDANFTKFNVKLLQPFTGISSTILLTQRKNTLLLIYGIYFIIIMMIAQYI